LDPLAPIFGVEGLPYQPRLVSMEKILESGFIGCAALLMGGLIVGTLAAVWLENKRVGHLAARRRRP